MKLNYRPEIDGLRAVAVLPVILFHAGFSLFSGGYIGVDVFFVISGYLITSVIFKEIERGDFSVSRFYERRVRRILPALYLVLLASMVFAWIFLFPSDMKYFCRSVVATVLFSSNINFVLESNYFDLASELKPLLHTWSLGVEEQYYLLFPPVIMLIWGRKKVIALFLLLAVSSVIIFLHSDILTRKECIRLAIGAVAISGAGFIAKPVSGKKPIVLLLLICAAGASLAFAQWGTKHAPVQNFYLLPFRGWEILIGAIVAVVGSINTEKQLFSLSKEYARLLTELAAIFGLALIAYAIFKFNENTPFPSIYALVPTLGAALIIAFATEGTLVAKTLSLKPVQGVGMVSYSAYLWHQPLFAFARLASLTRPDEYELALLAVLSLVLAYLSWRFVENPFRNSRVVSRKWLIIALAPFTVFFISFGAWGYLTDGYKFRIPIHVRDMAVTGESHIRLLNDECNVQNQDYKLRNCVRGDARVKPKYAIIGDSHAGAIVHILDKAFLKAHKSFLQYTKNGNAFALGLQRYETENSDKYLYSVFEQIKENKQVDTYIIATEWSYYASNGNRGQVGIPDNYTIDGVDINAPPSQRNLAIKIAYKNTILKLLALGKRVVLIYSIPRMDYSIPTYAAKVMLYTGNEQLNLSTSYAGYLQYNRDVTSIFDGLGDRPGLRRVRPAEIFCNTYQKDRCVGMWSGVAFYFDNNHPSSAGATLIVDKIMDQLK